ncbi:hypothetical protein PENTCL1PPCAC_10642 [Pristionchus entomophagus]|uniref:Mitochondrial import inner membrane translocase subunit tim-16 n=1 Tax=Pristionchus entomophagus TaxID=358040 RepID=A0AAV5SYS1_9BILA|nr:hypothetical protein PENTCL1PPCAC_10642 [Pristionchus entomophagus]
MVWRNAVKIALAAGEAFGKALTKAVKEEIKVSQQAAERQAASSGGATREDTRQSANANARLGISLEESLKILDVKEPLKEEEVRERYDFLFKLNDKTKNGSFYLQSKVYRAKERIDEELINRGEKEREVEPKVEEEKKIEEKKAEEK